MLSGFFSGIVASIPTTVAIVKAGEENKSLRGILPGAVMLATTGGLLSQLPMILVASAGNFGLLKYVAFPVIISFLVGVFLNYNKILKMSDAKEHLNINSPFALAPALKFAALYFIVTILAGLAERYVGSEGSFVVVLITSFISTSSTIAEISSLTIAGGISPAQAGLLFIASLSMSILNKFIWARTKDKKSNSEIVWNIALLLAVFLISAGIQYFLFLK